MGIVNDNRCSFCQQEDETSVHLFWDCIHFYTFIAALKTMLRQIMNNELHFSKAEFILGSHQMKPCINITFMIAKLHIFSCISSIQKCITIWRDFIILLVENPTRSSTWIWASHRLSSSVFPLCMFFFKYYMYFVFFVCIF